MTIDPTTKFVIGVLITTAIGISTGAVHLTHAIPDAWIPMVVAWSGILAFIGSAVQTGLQGFGMSTQSRISAVASLPEVSKVVTTSEVANSDKFADNDKVVSK